MNYSERIRGLKPWLYVSAFVLITACNNGRVISNELMSEMYPKSFSPGSPEYLERDFEAGADFICDEIKIKYQRDICSESEINWRR
jgi:hypothetical protein